jgi:2-keto-4-pentenoate hydratase/2-oxohepta-3-ene-1,7-dioic acid hydratase in catechol pathway
MLSCKINQSIGSEASRLGKNVFCVGRNYAEHIAEGERAQNIKIGVTEVPVFFTKPPTAVIGPGADPDLPDVSTSIDYEVELAVVIGKAGRDIPPERAFEHIFGYTIVNDVSARDVQRRHGGQYFKGKGSTAPARWAPGSSPPTRSPIRCRARASASGSTARSARTSTTAAMIFDIPTLIASLSAGLTLEPGDIIATGTPSGVGYAMDPPRSCGRRRRGLRDRRHRPARKPVRDGLARPVA